MVTVWLWKQKKVVNELLLLCTFTEQQAVLIKQDCYIGCMYERE